MNNPAQAEGQTTAWQPNVILVDADYLDAVAFDLIVNFERMIGRRIPPADLCHWLDCIALDGGLKAGDNQIQVAFLHDKDKAAFDNVRPASFAELDGHAFKDALGEFQMSCCPVEPIVSAADLFCESLAALFEAKEVERLMIVGNMEEYGDRVRSLCAKAERGKEVTLFAMQPQTGRGFYSEILGYSLMSDLGISHEELK